MADVSVLEVLLYGESIGTLTRVPGDRSLFAFNEDYKGLLKMPSLAFLETETKNIDFPFPSFSIT